MDKEHFRLHTTNMPPETHDKLRKIYLEEGLLLDSDNIDNEGLMKLIEQHQNRNLGAQRV